MASSIIMSYPITTKKYGIIHHHKVILCKDFLKGTVSLFVICLYLCLVPQILTNFPGGKIPHLDKSIHGSGDQELSVRRKPCTLYVSFLTKLKK